MATLTDFLNSIDDLALMYPPINFNFTSAMYAGPIEQEIAEQMQADMDALLQRGFNFDGEVKVQTDADKCIQARTNYYNDFSSQPEEFGRFQDTFSFAKGYPSEDPIDSFLSPPSAPALEAFKQF